MMNEGNGKKSYVAKIILSCLLVISLGGNAYQYLRTVPLTQGGGTFDVSPDGRFYADAGSRKNTNPLAPDAEEIYGHLQIRRQPWREDERPLLEVFIRPAQVLSEHSYREEATVTFSEDSKTVTVKAPSGTYILNVPGEQDGVTEGQSSR